MIFSIEIRGMVQGVGFRPFIYTLGTSMHLSGEVSNNDYGVLILLDATQEELDKFIKNIRQNPPPLSEIESIEIREVKSTKQFSGFTIQKTQSSQKLTVQIPSDVAICKECQDELMDRDNRRFKYPFIACINCGPRYSII
ncbi:MAG: acylphosphatase, partial [Sulfurimonas sp.]